MKKIYGNLLLLLNLCFCSSEESKEKNQIELISKVPVYSSFLQKHPIQMAPNEFQSQGEKIAIATQGPHSAKIAQEIIDQGGNLIDAAVAASFAISVERPHSTGIGGGGFLLFREGKSGQVFAVDFRERAPRSAEAKMFQDSQGNVITEKSLYGAHAVAIPGMVAGLFEIHQKWGKISWQKLLEPAARLAETGIEVYPNLAQALNEKKQILARFPETQKIFLKADSTPYTSGELLIQKDLAITLRKIGRRGKKAIFEGEFAKSMAAEVKRLGAELDEKDLASYKVRWKHPLQGSYKGFEIYGMPPPSSGGVHVIQILNLLENDSLKNFGHSSTKHLHLSAATMQMAFADRAKFLGDDEFTLVPLKGLGSKSYALKLRQKIDLGTARKSKDVLEGDAWNFENEKPIEKEESTQTTHFSMMDNQGNMIASTQTINGYFGSGVVVPGTGVLLNNEMDDFVAKAGVPNLFGALGGDANAVVAGKAPLSSMSPTLILKNAEPIMALGGPGGTRIITCVAQSIVNYLDFQFSLFDSIAAIRHHHQWSPDRINLEDPGPSEKVQKELQKMGYETKGGSIPCVVNAVAREGILLKAVADPRDQGGVFAR